MHHDEDYGPQDLVPLGKLKGWRVSEEDPDIRNWPLVDDEREKIGRVEDLLVSQDAGKAMFAIVSYGATLGVGGDNVLLPIDRLSIDRRHERAVFDGAIGDLKASPRYHKDVDDYTPFYKYWGMSSRSEDMDEEDVEDTEGEEPRISAHKSTSREGRVVRVRKMVEIPVEVTLNPEDAEEIEEEEDTPRRTKRDR